VVCTEESLNPPKRPGPVDLKILCETNFPPTCIVDQVAVEKGVVNENVGHLAGFSKPKLPNGTDESQNENQSKGTHADAF
jgi:hypothetical protein